MDFPWPPTRLGGGRRSAEDLLLAKLEWAKLGESERQIRDAAGIIEIQGAALDIDYVERWAAALDIEDQLSAARPKAG